MSNLVYNAAKSVLEGCLAVKKGEKLLLVTDDGKLPLTHIFKEAAQDLGLDVVLMEGPVQEGGEPPRLIADALLAADAAMLLTSGSLTHTHARGNATKKGVRIASLPRITQEVIEKTFDVDYAEMGKITNELVKRLTEAERVRVTTELGTDITLPLGGREAMPDAGDLSYTGAVGNLPAGEAMISPVEGCGDGVIVVDGVIAGIGILDSPLTFTIEKGRIVHAEGAKAKAFQEYIGAYDAYAAAIAEFGIGTNPKCEIMGNPLSDEKIYGTIHIGFGNNLFMGGAQDSDIHYDCIITKPTVYLDDTCIIKDGRHIYFDKPEA